MAATYSQGRPGLGRPIVGLILGLCMVGWGVRNVVVGMGEVRGSGERDALLARPEPPAAAPRAWETCSAEEIAYAQSRPGWVSPPGLDFTGSWSFAQHAAATSAVFPPTLVADAPLPRDCWPAGGEPFRRFASVERIRAIALDETASLGARVAAIGQSSTTLGAPAALYCGAVWLDDYQWECARLTTASLAAVGAMLPLAARAEQQEPSLGRNESWTRGLSTMRSAIVETGGDALRLLELPAGVRPGVRALLAHMLAEDYAAARALVIDTTPLPAIRQRLIDLVAREQDREVHEALVLALQRWP